ncbi:hypothetical protein K491DRAFT_707302 [Lophiostoma macrostomum CBS 122681]|uniref:Frequency clock protein n=1 Tax=Lophiostoma macrostomum CBS 122681 TaxID=1314788 RepID=A0A6A6SWU8_9PLEO|nr:hypothetical protein K491DRAFT_707302 [Lophiostoma macrostomum CBS 122681]
MNEVPGTIPRSITPHPRRPPAHKSVSLRHSPPVASARKTGYFPQPTSLSSLTAPASDKANPPSTVSPKANVSDVNKQSSGESSDAGKWFENTNNDAKQSSTSFMDNDPPFFLRNSSSSETPPDGYASRGWSNPAQSTLPHRPGLMRLGTDGSSAEEFRSVIDDLTIANKKLKQKLKKYEKMYDAHLQDEKLFEVRFHGLPDHKKKELEETLRKFAADIDQDPRVDPTMLSYAPPLDTSQSKTASSTSRFAESGYVSMSNTLERQAISQSQYNRKQQNIRSYLHDIPAGLLPRQNVTMSEKAKKKTVVRRLEQIFAGKQSVPGTHSQPLQQEEVAQSAAMADRRAREATGQMHRKEGHREARIMPVRSEDEDITGLVPEDSLQRLRPALQVNEQDFAGSGSPDQRPTRPLDLDPYRAQVPMENMDYIRHLGFTPPYMMAGGEPQDGHGWIYLNLLINMAQLHTFNVTPDFVKGAVTEYSSNFELSHDGRKIRWKGSEDITRNSDSSSEHFNGLSPYDVMTGSMSKSSSQWAKTGNSGGSSETLESQQRAAKAVRERDQNKLAYTPIFFHKEESDADDGFEDSSGNSPFMPMQRGDSSGFASTAMRSSSSRKRREDGPIIFYNKAKFCTDLTGDRRGPAVGNASYKAVGSQPLGAPARSEHSANSLSEPRGPLDRTRMDLDEKEGHGPTSSENDLQFSPPDLRTDTSSDSPGMMDFEASGLGGVQPDDHFAIRVKRAHVRTRSSSSARVKSKKNHVFNKRILDALNEQQSSEEEQSSRQPAIKEEILSASRKSLPNSILPPASFLTFDSTSFGDVDSDLESNVSSRASTTSSSDNGPATALRLLNISPNHPTNSPPDEADSSSDSGEEQSDDDGSVDFLHEARKLDPSIVTREREYDATIADRLAEEIPAGSSAATAGGGSGFTTPAHLSIFGEEESVDKRSPRSRASSIRTKNLKRARTSDSIATAWHSGKSQKLN